MGLKVNSKETEFEKISAVEMLERFKSAFDLDPTLTPETFYQILRGVDFNMEKAILEVFDRVKQPNQFVIPRSIFRSASQSLDAPILSSQAEHSDEARNASRSIKKKSAPQGPIEDSDEEIIFLNGLEEKARKRLSLSAFKTTPKRIPSFISEKSLGEADTDSDDKDVRPMKRRCPPTVPLRAAKSPELLTLANKNPIKESGFKRIRQSEVAESFQFTSTLDSANEGRDLFPQTSARTNSTQSSVFKSFDDFKVELSDIVESDDGDESGSDTSPEGVDGMENVTSPKRGNKMSQRRPKGQRGNQNEIVLKHRIKTKATPWLYRLARLYFPTTLEESPVAGLRHVKIKDKNTLDLKKYLEDIRKHIWEHKTARIEFEGPSIWQDKDDRLGYASANIDGQNYRPGDCVIVRSIELDTANTRGKKTALAPETENSDRLPNPWYARIIYLYKDEHGEEMAHFRWFQHGAETALGELASPCELFLLTECNDSPLACIYRKIQVYKKNNDESACSGDTGIVELDLPNQEDYFYRLHYHIRNEQFTDASMHETYSNEYQHGAPHCECCERRTEHSRNRQTRIIGDTVDNGSNHEFEGFHHQGVDYFLHDFVYIFDDSLVPYRIGQIKRIYVSRASRIRYSISSKPVVNDKNLMIKVDLYDRYDRFHATYFEEFQGGRSHATRDERRLYKSGKRRKFMVDQLDGKCYVRHQKDIEDMEMYKDENDRFWVADKVADEIHPGGVISRRDLTPLPPNEFKYAEKTEIKLTAQANRVKSFLKNTKKLRGLDIFAGAGGLSLGMHMSDAVETLWAFEFSEAACESLRKNLPNAKVYNVDANTLLERAILLENGEKLPPLLDCLGNLVPDLPRQDEVDIIFGGPPCPGFSASNRYPKAEDIRNSLIVLYLSFLDFYRPKYFLLENVKEILSYRLGARQVSVSKIEGGIERGMLKFILRALTSLGYQAQFTVLQAAEHNTPQCRRRAIIWASQLGYPLPDFPEPNNVVKTPRQYSLSWHRSRRAAAQPTVSIGDAILDLPAFDWINPHRKIPQSREQRSEREERWHKITQYECEENAKFIGRDHQSYSGEPLSGYQRKMRASVRKNELSNHVTMHWDENRTMVTEQVCNVPLRPGADHRDLPQALTHWGLTSPDSAASRNGNYPGRIGRLDTEDISGTCMTKMDPNGKFGKVLHPTQYRVISLREYARIMSFPDSYVFDLKNMRMQDVVRQLGNAVPPNFAEALARSLRDALINKFEEDQRRSGGAKMEDRGEGHMEVRHRGGSWNHPITLEDDDDEFVEVD